MCLASRVENVFFFEIYNASVWEIQIIYYHDTVLGRETRRHTQLDRVCSSCVFGKLWDSTLPSLFSVLDVFFFYIYHLQNCSTPILCLHSFIHPSMLIRPVSCHLSISLSHSSLHSPPTLSFDEVLWGLCCWPRPRLLHNNPIRLSEPLLG